MSGFSRSRRIILIGTAGAALLGGAAMMGLERYRRGRPDWIADLIRRNLPGQPLDEAALREFSLSMSVSPLFDTPRRRAAVAAMQVLPDEVWLPEPVAGGVESLERQLLTEFLLGSGYFSMAHPEAGHLSHRGAYPDCGNPFAVLLAG